MRSTGGLRRVVLLALFVLLAGWAHLGAKEVPFLSARVNDLANLFPPGDEERLEELLRTFEARTGAQMAVLTVESLEGDPVEDFSIRVAETWKLGNAERDDGLLLVIARDERAMRLEVGYGLEPRITDAHSRRILGNVLRPAFRQGDFAGGVERAVGVLGELAAGGDVAIDPPSPPPSGSSGGDLSSLLPVFFLALFSLQALLAGKRASLVLLLVLGPVLFILLALFVSGSFGKVLGLSWTVVYLLFYLYLWYTRSGAETRKRWRSASSSSGGRGGGWISSGGGFSSGGFSGGGGSFGGGGASGSW